MDLDHAKAIADAFTQLASQNVAFEVADIGPRVIHPSEAALMTGAVESRRREFETGRWCAARALARLGAAPAPILRGAVLEPLWPSGFTGSIAHHGRVAVAAACASKRRAAIGVDLADCSNLEPYVDVLPLTRSDADDLGFVNLREPIAAAYLFSMKEAAIKCLSPRQQAFLEFSDLTISPAPHGCRIEHARGGARVSVRTTRVGNSILSFASIDEDAARSCDRRPVSHAFSER